MPHSSKDITIWQAAIPVFILITLLALNIFYADGTLIGDYSNQYILVFAAFTAFVIGLILKTPISVIFKGIFNNLKSVFMPILILFLVGALAGTWLISGVIPTMVYYGLTVLNPHFFLPASVLIAALISVVTGSSWTTSATVGIALIGIGMALGIDKAMIAGAVISGSYFGDKISPLSDTTNLASAVAGTNLFTHIRYLSLTTVPSMVITLIVFTIISFTIDINGTSDVSDLQNTLATTFNISLWLFIVPLLVIGLILLKTKPLLALLLGIILAAVFALIFQGNLILQLTHSSLKTIIQSVFSDISIPTEDQMLADLFSSGGMKGMIWTVLLIVSAMIFGGVMDAIGALAKITTQILMLAKSTLGLFTSTVFSCIGLNVIASDQYLAIVIPGKMFKKAFDDKSLAPENLSRTLEDTGTVTSVLVPWNTCGAYEAKVLGVDTLDYFIYAIFNYVSPIMTLIFAAFRIKIQRLVVGKI